MIRTLTLIFASAAVGALIGFGLMYLAISRSSDVSAPISTVVPCAVGWGNVRP